ncbi:MAG: hypothetical protein ACR2G7_00550 [Acidimicrobiales bacterium]
MDGKSDWMAYGLAVEGEEGPFAGGALAEAAMCGPDDDASAVAERLQATGAARSVVVNEEQVVVGLVGLAALQGADQGAAVASLMAVIPSTVRPSVPLSSLAGADEPVLVTDSAGKLLGVVEPEPEPEPGGDTGEEAAMEQLQGTFLEIVHAAEEHFGGREPSEEEMRAFLHQRLVDEGRSAEEADAYLEAMGQDEG